MTRSHPRRPLPELFDSPAQIAICGYRELPEQELEDLGLAGLHPLFAKCIDQIREVVIQRVPDSDREVVEPLVRTWRETIRALWRAEGGRLLGLSSRIRVRSRVALPLLRVRRCRS